MITIERESFYQIIDDIIPLLMDHWDEIAHYKDKIPLSPMFDVYQKLEENQNLFIVAMREDKKLIGYSIYMINRHAHYSTCLVAANDVLYLIPEKRAASLGMRLIIESDKLLITNGINRITYHIKPEHDFSPLLKRLGYMQEEIMYGRYIESKGD